MKKIKWKNTIIIIILVLSIFGLIISSYNIVKWKIDSNKTKNQIEVVQKEAEVTEVEDSVDTEVIEQVKEIPKADPYWDYIKMNLINVNFDELKNKNNETKGWIQVNGTNINYPFVQAPNNEYYLNHSFDKTFNMSGWVFLDYRNNIATLDKNTILYAHGRNDITMFGSLKRILTSGWLQNSNNFVIKLSTEYENTLWQVFSVYRIPTTSDYLQTIFIDDTGFINFTNILIDRSAHNFNITINPEDKIITLSTCYNDFDKVVLHAKLIKKESR